MINKELTEKVKEALEPVYLDNVLEIGNFYDNIVIPNSVINRVLYQEILEEMPLTLEEIPELDYEISQGDYLNAGGEGEIYSLGKRNVGKILRFPRLDTKECYVHLLGEGIRQDLISKRGIKVPKVEGIFKIKRKKDGKTLPILVMKKIEGFALDEFPSNPKDDEMYNFYLDLGKRENEKACKLGIYNTDFGTCNLVADLKKKQTYLIDCADWKIEGVDFSEIKLEGYTK